MSKYLIPSMLRQGIDQNDIRIYNDVTNYGNLMSTMSSYETLPEKGSTWHLQDDVIISSDFKEQTEKWNEGIVCGFCNRYSEGNSPGETCAEKMWMSFQCILIPNEIARGCAKWYHNNVEHNPEYRMWVRVRKYDDSIFKIYVKDYCDGVSIYNLSPNIVNHIDYLIGGSTINSCRGNAITDSLYWREPELIKQLERDLKCQYGR